MVGDIQRLKNPDISTEGIHEEAVQLAKSVHCSIRSFCSEYLKFHSNECRRCILVPMFNSFLMYVLS